MAHKITDECVACGACADTCVDCGACEDVCPTGAIKAE